jgi:hypothetical protein
MRSYVRVSWNHNLADEPTCIYSEVEGAREIRKVEIFADGHLGYADALSEVGGSVLAEGPMPSPETINKKPEFHAVQISAEVFGAAWLRATSSRAL